MIPSENMKVTMFLYLSMVLVPLIQSFHWWFARRTKNEFIQLQAILQTMVHMFILSEYDTNAKILYIQINIVENEAHSWK